jgi:hypothetical protein
VSDLGGMRGYFGGVPATLKVAMDGFINYAFKNLRVGLPGHQKPAENFSWFQLDGVTSSNANQEFSIAHGQTVAPRVAFPCIDLTSSGTQLVALTVARAADARRVYFRSGSTSAAFTIFVETRG